MSVSISRITTSQQAAVKSVPDWCFYSAWYSCPHTLMPSHVLLLRMVFIMPSLILMSSCPHTYSWQSCSHTCFYPHGIYALTRTHALMPSYVLMPSCPHTCFYSAWYSCPQTYSCPRTLQEPYALHLVAQVQHCQLWRR